MSANSTRLGALLRHQQLDHEVVAPAREARALRGMPAAQVPEGELAKAVVLRIGDGYAMAVLPADRSVDVLRFGRALGGLPVSCASEAEIRELCPDCEPDAIPPFGTLYGLQVYLCPELARCERITCAGGDHAGAIRLAYRDYEALVRPRLLDFAAARGSLALVPVAARS